MKTPLINQLNATYKHIIKSGNDLFPDIQDPLKKAAEFLEAQKYFKINLNNIKHIGNDDDYTNNFIHKFVFQDAGQDLDQDLEYRGLTTKEDWKKRKEQSDYWMELNLKPEEFTADNIREIRNKHFAMTQDEFNETVLEQNKRAVRDRFNKELREGVDFIKELYDERKAIEPLKIAAGKD